jgi:SAM-dependent methyltransferase
MLTRQEKAQLREEIFRHLDGIATAPTAFALHERGVLNHLLEQGKTGLTELTQKFSANEGYLNVALRVLCSQGWLIQHLDNATGEVYFETNEKSGYAFTQAHIYKDAVSLLDYTGHFHPRKFEKEPFRLLESILHRHKDQYGWAWSDVPEEKAIQQQMLKHIEGILIGPTTVHLGMNGMFHKYFMEASFRPDEFHTDPDSFVILLDFLTWLGWFNKGNNQTYRFTEKGLFFARRASAYGVTVSYIPTFRKVFELIFGDPNILRQSDPLLPELHVDREMNVWGSGGAHTTYFKKVDEVIIDLFNKPIHEQPRGILDMGCGNGAFLRHIYEVIEQRTQRGTMLEDYPLFLVGADFNEAALRVTRSNLFQADIWAKVIWGDIGRPDLLAKDLKDDYGIELSDLLNVRTFLDHNRIWQEPETVTKGRVSTSTGAFAFRGKRLLNNHVEDNLLLHFKKWAPYVKRFGLLVIELHTIDPALAASHIGQTAVSAYDATHGFSDQYIVEVEVFQRIAAEAGLNPVEKYFSKFPDSDLATISINLLRGGA